MNPKLLEQCSIVGKEGITQLKGKTVTIVGIGGVGTTLAQILARNGINLRIVDKDRIYDYEMPRMTVYANEDVGKFKAKQMKKRLESMTTDVKIKTFHEDLKEANLFLLDSDMIIDTSNNLETSRLINKYAIEKNTPLLFCNYSGRKGNIIIIDKKSNPTGPCLECIYDELKMPDFKEVGVYSPLTTFLAGLSSSMIIKNLLGEENEQDLHQINIIKTRISHKKVTANKKCSVCGKK
jgi:molybdopterin/thiamine biosynthesis adenylyltransferase